ncbi:MAG: hypothetical protein M1818_000151 [Claussenomyces sp. TS43310]|nr:MAG: hypothetical protein M1818_000151 [Claussenomyces sp. TS43310]
MNNAVPPRRRNLTYGKAVRKRPPEHVSTSKLFQAIPIVNEGQGLGQDFQSSLTDPAGRGKSRSSLSEQTSSRSECVFDVDTSTAPKKRKLVRPTRTSRPKDDTGSSGVNSDHQLLDDTGSLQSLAIPPRMQIPFKAYREHRHLAQSTSEAMQKSSETPRTGMLRTPQGGSLSTETTHIPSVSTSSPRLSTQTRTHAMASPQGHGTTGHDAPESGLQTKKRPSTPGGSIPPLGSAHTHLTRTPSLHNDDMTLSSPESATAVFTPKGLKMWYGLLGDDTVETSVQEAQFFGCNAGGASARQLPRRRLIDSLVEQATNPSPTFTCSSDSEDDERTVPVAAGKYNAYAAGEHDCHSTSTETEALIGQPTAVSSGNGNQSSQSLGTRVTYSRHRSMLAEQDLAEKTAFDAPLHHSKTPEKTNRRGSVAFLAPFKALRDNDNAEENLATSSIRTVHELRQAGANNRFADEIEDLLDRIGKPSTQTSTRRLALLDLAGKLYEKQFHEKFIAHGMDQRLFVHLGQETDITSGYLMISLLLFIIHAGMTPALLEHLHREGFTCLILRLIDVEENIVNVAKDRKNNISKMVQTKITEHQAVLVRLSVWEDMKPSTISPRTVALRALELIVCYVREPGNPGDVVSKELTGKLFTIVSVSSNRMDWKTPNEQRAIDFRCALSTLESHSLKAMATSNGTSWVEAYVPTIKDILESILRPSVEDLAKFHILALRLTLNVTNNNPGASDVFATPQLMLVIACAIVAKFQLLTRFLIEEERLAVVDHLVLMLGVMINFAEWSLKARECFQALQRNESDPLGALVQVFLDNLGRVSEADSVEDSHRNVAFGYLSVLLGFLCLSSDIQKRVRRQLGTASLQPLTASIEEFISHHKRVDDLFEYDADGFNPQVGLTERLQRMVTKLNETEVFRK